MPGTVSGTREHKLLLEQSLKIANKHFVGIYVGDLLESSELRLCRREGRERGETENEPKTILKTEGEFSMNRKIRTPSKWCQPNTPLGEVATLGSQTHP